MLYNEASFKIRDYIGDNKMDNIYNKTVSKFLEQTRVMYERKQELQIKEIVEQYKKISKNIKVINKNISKINTEYRVEICRYLDKFLDIIVDSEIIRQDSVIKNVYTMHHLGEIWSNQILLKDKGITGYLLAKELDAKAIIMYGSKDMDYPYLEYLEGVELLEVETSENIEDMYYKYLRESYEKMDVLVLHGIYPFTIVFLNEYRKYRPDGKVYCGLDMNIWWMNKIDWTDPIVTRFSEQCDIITTSSSYVRDVVNINKNIPFYCRYIPNGFYNAMGNRIIADVNKKENIILTVGRIGVDLKNNEDLMIAFAKVEHMLKDWSVHLVGGIQDEFQPFINEYFKVYPELKERVIFRGLINDKDELYNEYAKAKCFILTSISEGGTPNVYAEALFHGCMFITSDIDAANEIVNNGELGEIYKCKDTDELAECMIRMASRAEDEEEMKMHIQKAIDYGNRVYDWNRNAKKIAYMLNE